MDPLPPPLAFFLLVFSGWLNRHQQAVIDLWVANRYFPPHFGIRHAHHGSFVSGYTMLSPSDTARE